MTRAQIRARLSGDRGQALVPLPWWARVDAALDRPETHMVLLWMQRQSGKTQYLMLRACEELLLVPNSYTLFVTASRDQAEAIFHRKLRQPLQRLLQAAGLPPSTIKLTQSSAENPAINAALEIVASSEATVPSRSVSLLVLDEGKYIADPVFAALLPSVIASRGRVLVASTAGPPAGWFYAACTGDDAEVAIIRVDGNVNPYADPGVLGFVTRLLDRVLPLARKRDIDNLFAEDGDRFVSAEVYDACVEPTWSPCWPTKETTVFIGVDAAVKDDTACAFGIIRDNDQLIAAFHRIWRPSRAMPLDLGEVEAWILDKHQHFRIQVLCDPYQMQRSMSALRAAGVTIEEYAQTPANLTKATQTLFEVLTSRALVLYPSDEVREQLLNAVVSDAGSRGYKLEKSKSAAKIDSAVALSMACVAAIDTPAREPAFVV